MSKPNNTSTVSVVMCTYNGAEYLREQLNSILNQTYPIYEIIIQDDGSTDDTFLILREYAILYPFVKPYRNEHQKGINTNFYTALQRATGDFIAISDQDDCWEPDKIEVQMSAIGDKWLCGGFSKPFSTDGLPIHFDTRVPNFDILRLLYINPISGHTQLFRRELLDRIPMQSAYLPLRYYDAIIALVAAAENSIVFVEKVLVHHRRHNQSMTYSKPKDNSLGIKSIAENIKRTFRLYNELKPEMKRRLGMAKHFLEALPTQTPAVCKAERWCELQQNNTWIGMMRKAIFCVRHRTQLFHTSENKGYITWLRALYFPVSSSDYFRYLSKEFKRY